MNKPHAFATIKDVARHAGLSTSTVSRALNKPGRASDKTVAIVRASAKAVNYIPSRAAGSLVSKRFRAIGALVPTIQNEIFAHALHALQARLHTYGYTLLVASTHYNAEREVAELQSLIEHGVDAIVLVGAEHDAGVKHLLSSKQMPYINTWVYDPKSASPCLGLDNHAAMSRMTKYLLDLGHKSFAVLAGITDHNDRAKQRLEGALAALAQYDVVLEPERILQRPYTIAAGRNALRTIMALPSPPTAVICGNDILAFGAIYECAAAGIKVPQALSITGFDDFEQSAHMTPSLTTVRVPAADMGVGAADYLVSVLENKPTPHHIEFEAELIVRGSTAPPRKTEKP